MRQIPLILKKGGPVLPPLPSDALAFRRSSYCGEANCVEVAALPSDQIAVRDTKNDSPDAPILVFSVIEWNAFLNGVLDGEFSPSTLSTRP
jgi:hypothetical protein